MHIYSKNGAVPVIFVVHWSHVLGLDFVEYTHISNTGYAATRSTLIFADTNSDTEFITTEQLISHSPSISRTTLTTVFTWDNVEIAHIFLQQTDHMVLPNILIFICFVLILTNTSARYF